MGKAELLEAIIRGRDGLKIEEVFGRSAWYEFSWEGRSRPPEHIVVVGNGPVKSRWGERVDGADIVIRCNDYQSVGALHTDEGLAKIGSKCDIQFICLHAGEFKRTGGVGFLHDWIAPTTRVVCALENSSDRVRLQRAIEDRAGAGDETMRKIVCANVGCLRRLFEPDSTRGFYALAFALQARARLGLRFPVECIGFGRRGHEGNPEWPIHHGHRDELIELIELWKRGDRLWHLEWGRFKVEIVASVPLRRYFRAVPRMRELERSVQEEVIGRGLANLQCIVALVVGSSWYGPLNVQQLTDMATHGLMIHPAMPAYLTCSACRSRRGRGPLYSFKDWHEVLAHFTEGHKEEYMAWRRTSAEVDPPEGLALWGGGSVPVVDVGRRWGQDGVVGPRAIKRGAPPAGVQAPTKRPRGSAGRSSTGIAVSPCEDEWELWSWIEKYAAFQSALHRCSSSDHHSSVFDTCGRTLEVLQEGAPREVLDNYATSKGATWEDLVDVLQRYFSSGGHLCGCCERSQLLSPCLRDVWLEESSMCSIAISLEEVIGSKRW